MLTKYAASKILYEISGLKSSTIFGGSEIYLGLSTTAPQIDGTGVSEPPATRDGESTNYSRFKLGYYSNMPTDLIYMSNPTSPSISATMTNKNEIHFNVALQDWTTGSDKITHVCIFNGTASSANLLAYGALNTPIQATQHTVVVIPKEGFTITVQ